jgi:hypothetical protein
MVYVLIIFKKHFVNNVMEEVTVIMEIENIDVLNVKEMGFVIIK